MVVSAAAVTRSLSPPSMVGQMIGCESAAAAAFESRWTMRALKRVDADLCQAIDEQRALFHEAILTGEDDQIKEHGEAMCRGWQAAVVRMEQAGEPDDSYVLGSSGGVMVAIGSQRSASARVRELHGDRVVWLTPDEIAAMFVGMQTVATVKALWPGAEIVCVDRYPDEPAREDT
jgi:hypothetical protein